MTAEEKAKELIEQFMPLVESFSEQQQFDNAKKCALIAVEFEYYSSREQIFNLRSSGVIESEKVYLFRIDALLREEQQVKTAIENYQP